MIRWALNLDEAGNFKGVSSLDLKSNTDFISNCFTAKNNHRELPHNVIIGLFYEVANMGRSKRKQEG